MENSSSDITAVCPQNQADPIQLKFRDILNLFHNTPGSVASGSLRLAKDQLFADRRTEHAHAWHLGDYAGMEVYLTYKTSILADTISSIYLSHQKSFILMAPTMKNITPEIQRFMGKNSSVLFSMEAELTLQPDGSFKTVRSIPECIKSYNQPCPQAGQNTAMPIEAYKHFVYSKA